MGSSKAYQGEIDNAKRNIEWLKKDIENYRSIVKLNPDKRASYKILIEQKQKDIKRQQEWIAGFKKHQAVVEAQKAELKKREQEKIKKEKEKAREEKKRQQEEDKKRKEEQAKKVVAASGVSSSLSSKSFTTSVRASVASASIATSLSNSSPSKAATTSKVSPSSPSRSSSTSSSVSNSIASTSITAEAPYPKAETVSSYSSKNEKIPSNVDKPMGYGKATRSPRKWVVTLILCLFFGVFGVHRFYVGKIGTGILQFFTAGGYFIWTFVDFVTILTGKFTDSKGNVIRL